MSFASDVKAELCERGGGHEKHCLAELLGMYLLGGKLEFDDEGRKSLIFLTENSSIAKKCFTFLKKSFNMTNGVQEEEHAEGHRKEYRVTVTGKENIRTVLKGLGLNGQEGTMECDFENMPKLLANQNNMKAFIRGMFLMCGRISDPTSGYHLEFGLPSQPMAEYLAKCIGEFTREPKLIKKKQQWVLYMKDGTQIADLLTLMEAHVSVMKYENERVVREVRGSINRRVNCEVSNLNKTMVAARKQVESIELIRERMGLENLPENLREIAGLRLEQPEASLQELGEMLKPVLGRSGVNHRLQKLCEIAEGLRSN